MHTLAMAKRPSKTKQTRPPSRLHSELAAKILRALREQQVGSGHHLVEAELSAQFAVSRTPIRGALQILAERGIIEPRATRGYVVRRSIRNGADLKLDNASDESEQALFISIARDRLGGVLPAECTQQELVRRYDVPVALVVKVLRQMADLGVVERKSGHGWSFLPSIDSKAASDESYDLRLMIEPAALLLPTFKLDPAWAAATRERHEYFLNTSWRPTMVVQFVDANADFHEGLARASQNRHVLHVIQQQNRLRRFLNYRFTHSVEQVRRSVSQHLEILTALEKGENKIAAVMMARHLEHAR